MNRFGVVSVDAPLEFVTITALEFCQEAGEHVWLKIRGIVKEDKIEDGIYMDADSHVEVSLPGEKELLFAGIPTSVKLDHGASAEVTLVAASRSILMDIEKKSRSFQRETMKYSGLMREIILNHGGDILVRETLPDDISAPFIQYRETDWQFLKRLASRYGCDLYANATGRVPQVYLGKAAGEDVGKQESSWQMNKQLEDYLRFRRKEDVMEQTFLQCKVTGNARYQIGDLISCSGISFQISGIKGELVHGEFCYTYQLAQKDYGYRLEFPNPYLQGSTFTGKVLSVGSGRIKIHLDMDEEQNEADAYWYPIQRTDWYCMPEAGSIAALSIPSGDEMKAYVTGIQRSEEDGDKMQDTENRSMGTADGKELKLTRESISVHASKNRVYMELTERTGVKVKSCRGIHLDAGSVFRCHGDTVTIESEERVLLRTRQTAIVLDEIVQVKG